MVTKKVLLTIFLIGIFMLNIQAQVTAKGEIQLVVSGDGINKEEATKIALRSAIEQAFGTFVSANTEMLNDEIINDEIVTISSGNIKNFEYIEENALDGKCFVTLKATVSIGKLVEYTKSKGAITELAGTVFAMNMKIKALNKQNELAVLRDLVNESKKILPCVFDYEIKVEEPKMLYNSYQCNTQIIVKTNENTKRFYDIFHNTLNSLSLSEEDCIEYASINMPISCIYFPNIENVSLSNNTSVSKRVPNNYFLRNENDTIVKYMQDLQSCIINNGILSFQIIDGIGNYWLKGAIVKDRMNDRKGVSLKVNQDKRFSLPDLFTRNSHEPFIIFDERSPKLKPEIRVVTLNLENVLKWREIDEKIIGIEKEDSLEHLRNEERRKEEEEKKKRNEEYQKKSLEQTLRVRVAIGQIPRRELRTVASTPNERQGNTYYRTGKVRDTRDDASYSRTEETRSTRAGVSSRSGRTRDTRDISYYKTKKIEGSFFYRSNYPILYGGYNNGEVLHLINLKLNYTLDELQKIIAIRIEPLGNNLKK